MTPVGFTKIVKSSLIIHPGLVGLKVNYSSIT
jgi:hypothetical protein